MTMDQAAVWLAGTILLMLGFVAVVVGIVVINNILHKYWKPVRIFTPDSWKGFNPPAEYEKTVEAPNVQDNIHRS